MLSCFEVRLAQAWKLHCRPWLKFLPNEMAWHAVELVQNRSHAARQVTFTAQNGAGDTSGTAGAVARSSTPNRSHGAMVRV